jgi:hypothetical protein
MTIYPYSIPPPRGWSPPINPDQQIIPPPIGSTPVGQPLPPPQGWSPAVEPGQQVQPISDFSHSLNSSSHYSTNHSFQDPYPLQPPIGAALRSYPITPPRGWTASVTPDPDLLPPPRTLKSAEDF